MRSYLYFAIAMMLVGAQLTGCASEELAGEEFKNEPPTVWLSSAPPEGTTSNYTVHLFWGGWDPDGEISRYEWLVTDNIGGVFLPSDTIGADWRTVVANDSIFLFTADVPFDSTDFGNNEHEPEEFTRSHTFFIRAVDERGIRSRKPAYRSFTARTLSPIVDVLVPIRTGLNPAQVPPITTFKWVGKDFVGSLNQQQDPESVRTILVSIDKFDGIWGETVKYIRTNPDAEEWSEWQFYRAQGDTGKFWTSPPLAFGRYMFGVQVKDEAGAVNPVFDLDRNLRRVLVSTRSSGPVLRVRNDFIGQIVTSSPNTPLTILDLPAGVPMRFEFDADASSYGGEVAGYRYGWDILDLNDDEQWEIDFTPFIGTEASSPRRTFFFGTHTFFIEVIDNSGFKSRVGVTLNIVPFTFRKTLLIVDDWVEGGLGWESTVPKGVAPSDGQHDQFWASMVDGVDGFNAATDMIQLGSGADGGIPEVPIQIIADYRTMIWNSAPNGLVGDMIRFLNPDIPVPGGRVTPNVIALYMSAGGHVLLTGQNVMKHVVNQNAFGGVAAAFPLIFRYELKGDQDGAYGESDVGIRGIGENSFAWKECCLNILDIASTGNPSQIRNPTRHACRTDNIRTYRAIDEGLRNALPIDATYSFPQLDLRSEVSAAGRAFETQGLQTDIYNPSYFSDVVDAFTRCSDIAEIRPLRSCFQPIYGLGCNDTNAVVFNAPVAFWTSVFGTRVPDSGGDPARSAIFGFYPVYIDPVQFKEALEIILFDEWKLLPK